MLWKRGSIALLTIVLTIALANISALALCTTVVADEYTCYPVGEDACYCYYDCYCKVSLTECSAALTRDGFEDVGQAH